MLYLYIIIINLILAEILTYITINNSFIYNLFNQLPLFDIFILELVSCIALSSLTYIIHQRQKISEARLVLVFSLLTFLFSWFGYIVELYPFDSFLEWSNLIYDSIKFLNVKIDDYEDNILLNIARF